MTNDEINRAVAVAMGYSVQPHQSRHRHGFRLMQGGEPVSLTIWAHESGAWLEAPRFCTAPAAADLVRLEIERRGWTWSIDPGMEGKKRYFCCVSGGTPRCSEPPYAMSEADSWMDALCLAFLAAVEAEKGASE